jgi:hypothetical protein
VSIRFYAYRDIPLTLLAGKVVIDTNNYFAARDGQIPEIDSGRTTEGELLPNPGISHPKLKGSLHWRNT